MTNLQRPLLFDDQGNMVDSPTTATAPSSAETRQRPGLIEMDETRMDSFDVGWNPRQERPHQRTAQLSSGVALSIGLITLFLGFVVTSTINYVKSSFMLNFWLGWVAVTICLIGFGLLSYAVFREVQGYIALAKWDDKRESFTKSAPIEKAREAATRWLAAVEGNGIDRGAICARIARAAETREILKILESDVLSELDRRADNAVWRASRQVAISVGFTPSARLDAIVFLIWSLHLVRTVAITYGLRPGNYGTFILLRRVLFGAAFVAGTDVGVSNLVQMGLSNEYLAKFVGDVGGAFVAGQRIYRLGRAAIRACRPLPVKSDWAVETVGAGEGVRAPGAGDPQLDHGRS